MMGPAKRRQAKLFYSDFDLEQRVPADHPLRRIRQAVNFDATRQAVADCYGNNGQVSLDPALVMKLVFLALYENVRSERDLMRQLPLRLDWLWFCELDVDEAIPHHSVLSKARRRWGRVAFESLFTSVLQSCVDAGLVSDEAWHADSTLLKANASVDRRVSRKLWGQLEQGLAPAAATEEEASAEEVEVDLDQTQTNSNASSTKRCDSSRHHDSSPPPEVTPPQVTPPQVAPPVAAPAPPQGRFNRLRVSRTDPDAATTRRRGQGVTLGYRDHRLVDDAFGVIVQTTAMPANYDDGTMLRPLLDQARHHRQTLPRRLTGDSAYGTAANYAYCAALGVRGYLKPRPSKSGRNRWEQRLPEDCPVGAARHWLRRRLSVAEGSFAIAHHRHHHRRCRWRGLVNVQIQCDLVALVQNVGKLLRYGRPRRGALAALKFISPWRDLWMPAVPLPIAVDRPMGTLSSLAPNAVGRWPVSM